MDTHDHELELPLAYVCSLAAPLCLHGSFYPAVLLRALVAVYNYYNLLHHQTSFRGRGKQTRTRALFGNARILARTHLEKRILHA